MTMTENPTHAASNGDVLRAYTDPRGPAAAAAAVCVKRRLRVLAQPDIARRLTQPPLAWTRPENWNGYIPPGTWGERLNDAPERAALLAILADVIEAEKAPAEELPEEPAYDEESPLEEPPPEELDE